MDALPQSQAVRSKVCEDAQRLLKAHGCPDAVVSWVCAEGWCDEVLYTTPDGVRRTAYVNRKKNGEVTVLYEDGWFVA